MIPWKINLATASIEELLNGVAHVLAGGTVIYVFDSEEDAQYNIKHIPLPDEFHSIVNGPEVTVCRKSTNPS